MQSPPGRPPMKHPRKRGGPGCPTESMRAGQGWLRSQPGLPAAPGVCWAPPAQPWAFTNTAQVAEAQAAHGYPVQNLLSLGKATCLGSSAGGLSAGLEVHRHLACRGQEGNQDLTWSSEVVVAPHNPFTASARCGTDLGKEQQEARWLLPRPGTVGKCPTASCPGHCRQVTLWWPEGAWAQESASQTPAGTAHHPRASLIEVSGLVGDGLEVFGE